MMKNLRCLVIAFAFALSASTTAFAGDMPGVGVSSAPPPPPPAEERGKLGGPGATAPAYDVDANAAYIVVFVGQLLNLIC